MMWETRSKGDRLCAMVGRQSESWRGRATNEKRQKGEKGKGRKGDDGAETQYFSLFIPLSLNAGLDWLVSQAR